MSKFQAPYHPASGGSLATGSVLGRQPVRREPGQLVVLANFCSRPQPLGGFITHCPSGPLQGSLSHAAFSGMPAQPQLAPLVPPNGDSSPSPYLGENQSHYLPGSPTPFPPSLGRRPSEGCGKELGAQECAKPGSNPRHSAPSAL